MSKSSHNDARQWRQGLPVDAVAPDVADDSSATDESHGALETFRFDVSAGEPAGASPPMAPRRDSKQSLPQGAADEPTPAPSARTDSPSRRDSSELAKRSRPAATPGGAPAATQTRRAVASQRPQPGRAAGKRAPEVAARVAVQTAAAPVKPLRAARRNVPGWAGSLLVHAAFLAILAVGTLQVAQPQTELQLTATAFSHEDEVELQSDIDVEPVDELLDAEELLELPIDEDLQLPELDAAALDEMLPGMASTDNAGDAGPVDAGLGTLGGLLDGSGLGGEGAGQGDAAELGGLPPPAFFGHKIEGNRIVFVLDNSGSMQGGRLETVIAELQQCVESLQPRQQFYVIFYSDALYPLFYPDPVMRFVRPTDRTKKQLAAWLETVELCLGDTVDEALAAAASIGPDAVYLLSDGRIQSQKKLAYLMAAETRDFPIHTVAVGLGRAPASREKLAMVAEANGGTFVDRDVPDEMKDLALKSPRPYHNQQPGAVWGRNVKNTWGRR